MGYMWILIIQTSGTWHQFVTTTSNGCDDRIGWGDMSLISKGGCQNPIDFYYWTNPWVNCKFSPGY